MEVPLSGSTPWIESEIVRAGAGAGKTTKLTGQVFEVAEAFAQRNDRFPRLVVTTFTRKATQELRERLVLKALKASDPSWLDYVTSPSQVHISTIHGVLHLFLSRYAHLMEFDNSFQLLSDSEEIKLQKTVLRELLSQGTESDLLDVFGLDVLVRLLQSYLHLEGDSDWRPVSRQELEALAFEQIKQPVEDLCSRANQLSTQVETESWKVFLGQVAGLLQPPADLQSLKSKLEAVTSKPRFSKKCGLDKGVHDAFAEVWTDLKKEIKKPSYDPSKWDSLLDLTANFQKLAKPFRQALFREKLNRAQISVGDLEIMTLEFLEKYPQVADQFCEDWDYWLVDEFQDTSPIQLRILSRLMGDRPQFNVGDPQQSIYLFRGARSEVFEQREQLFEAQGQKLSLQKTNYRSEPELLEFFNFLFPRLSSQFSTMQPKAPVSDTDKVVARVYAGPDEKDRPLELQSLLSDISERLKDGASYSDICILGRTNADLKKVAQALSLEKVPTFLHAASGFYDRREIADALSILKFLVIPEDNKNLVQLLRAPWFHIEDSEIVAIQDQSRGFLWHTLKSATLSESAKATYDRLESYRQLATQSGYVYSWKKALVDSKMIDFSRHFDATGRREANLWKIIHQIETEQATPGFNLIQFLEGLNKGYDLEEGQNESDAASAIEPNAINLMTVHGSKGLQFDHVYLPFMDRATQTTKSISLAVDESKGCIAVSGLDPETNERIETPLHRTRTLQLRAREDAESLRVFYVALTRAKKSVYMSWSGNPKKSSWAESLVQALPTVEEGVTSFGEGSYQVLSAPNNDWSFSTATGSSGSVSEPYSVTGIQPLRRLSVSKLIAESQPESDAVEGSASSGPPKRLGQLDAIQVGHVLHEVFERLNYTPDMDVKQWLQGAGLRSVEKMFEAVQFVTSLDEPPMLQLLTNGHVEWGFQMKRGGAIVEGQVDLWGEADGEVFLIDYKTGSEAYYQQAVLQLGIYAEAIKAYKNMSRVKTYVIYPLSRKVKFVGDL